MKKPTQTVHNSFAKTKALKLVKSIILCLGAMPLLSNAIVIRHDVASEKYDATPADFPPLATLYAIGVHGTLIHPEWVVTAAHAVFCLEPGQKLKVGEEMVTVANRYSHPDYVLGEKHDIALVRLTKPVKSVKPARLFQQNTENGMVTWFIGAGGTGNGITGQTIDTAENNGKLRKAENKIIEVRDSDIVFQFERGPKGLPLEGVSGNGDSGGPAYIKDENGFTLLGVSSRTGSWDHGAGEYGVIELYTRVSFYAGWIEKIISANNETLRHDISTQDPFLQPGMEAEKMPEICSSIEIKSVNP